MRMRVRTSVAEIRHEDAGAIARVPIAAATRHAGYTQPLNRLFFTVFLFLFFSLFLLVPGSNRGPDGAYSLHRVFSTFRFLAHFYGSDVIRHSHLRPKRVVQNNGLTYHPNLRVNPSRSC